MIVTNGLDISGKDYHGRREDLSFIVRFHWKTSNHLKEAIQVLLAARLAEQDDQHHHYASTSSLVRVLDESEFEQIRLQIASNPNTPPAVLDYLMKRGDERINERIAENPRSTQKMLAVLSTSASPSVRAAVAENPHTDEDTLSRLCDDVDADIRYRLAENPHCPEAILTILSQDNNPYVSSRASSTLSRMQGGMVVEGGFRDRSQRSAGTSTAISG